MLDRTLLKRRLSSVLRIAENQRRICTNDSVCNESEIEREKRSIE